MSIFKGDGVNLTSDGTKVPDHTTTWESEDGRRYERITIRGAIYLRCEDGCCSCTEDGHDCCFCDYAGFPPTEAST